MYADGANYEGYTLIVLRRLLRYANAIRELGRTITVMRYVTLAIGN